MAKYAVTLRRTISNALSVGEIDVGATNRRMKLYDLTIGIEAAPANFANLWQIQRFTAPGTNTPVTPQPLDPADGASLFTAGENDTINPTLTANQFLLTVALNQQATYRWVAAPGSELVVPSVVGNGLALNTPVVGTPAAGSAILLVNQE